MSSLRGKVYTFSVCAVLVTAGITSVYSAPEAYAAQITTRSLTLVAGATDGGSKPGGVVNHAYVFTVPSVGATNIGSIKFEYCTVAVEVACVAPTGMSAAAATFGNETGSAVTGFSMGTKTVNSFILAKASGTSVPAGSVVKVQANSITNPTTANQTFFVRITTFTGIDGATGPVDTGSVAASTANQITVTGVMPETLIFCTGATINKTLGIPDCTTAAAGAINFNQLFSPTDTATASSQMAASTNAASGYSITVNGTTLTSGGNTIPAMAAAATRTRGKSEFGMNLKLNTVATSTLAVGAEVDVAPNGTDLRGQAKTGYNTVDTFKFNSGDVVAASDFNVAGPTNAQIYTSSYIADVAGNQISGTYVATLTYICTPTY